MTKEASNSRVVRVHRHLVLCGITDETFGVRERNIGGGRPVTLVVGDDLDTIILPDTDATVADAMRMRRVCEINGRQLTSRWCPKSIPIALPDACKAHGVYNPSNHKHLGPRPYPEHR
jgi:hypothetical protein